MNLLLHGGVMVFGNQDGQGKLLHGGVLVSRNLNRLEITRTVILSGSGGVSASLKKTASTLSSVSGSGSISAGVQKVALAPAALSGFGDLSLSLFKEALIPIEVSGCGDVGVMILGRLYGDILIITNERLRVHGMVGETLRVHTPTGGRLWVSPL